MRPAESAAAAAEFVALTNNSSKDEDVVIGKTGALEVALSGVCRSQSETKGCYLRVERGGLSGDYRCKSHVEI